MVENNKENQDFYAILNVDPKASFKDIRKAYLQKAKKEHPDRSAKQNATANFQKINHAYVILSDPIKRKEYDENLNLEESTCDQSNLAELEKQRLIASTYSIITKAKEKYDWGWYSTKSVTSAMREAIINGHADIVKIFLDAGVPGWDFAYDGPNKISSHRFLYFAVKSGNINIVKLLVENDATVALEKRAEQNQKFEIALMMMKAIKHNRKEILSYLLENGANVNYCLDTLGERETTQIEYAARLNRLEILDLLFQYGGQERIEHSLYSVMEKYRRKNENYDYHFRMGYKKYDKDKLILIEENKLNFKRIATALMDYAIGCDFSHEFFEFLKSLDDVAGINFIGVSIEGKSITKELLLESNLKGVDDAIIVTSDMDKICNAERSKLLQKNLADAINKRGELIRNGIVNLMPLTSAALAGDVEAVQARLLAGADPNEVYVGPDFKSHTSIEIAAIHNNYEIAEILLQQKGFDKKTLLAAINLAEWHGYDDLASMLLDAQDVNQVNKKGNTMLHYAIYNGDVLKVKSLISIGADVNQLSSMGYPLEIAARNAYSYQQNLFKSTSEQHIEILKILLANHSIKGIDDALRVACSGSAESVALLLPLASKKDIIERDYNKRHVKIRCPWYTKLLFASFQSSEQIKILSLLKAEGANFNQKNRCGETLLHYVIRDFSSYTSVLTTMHDVSFSMLGCEDKWRDALLKDRRELIVSHKLAFAKNIKMLDFILENDVDTMTCNKYGDTPLHVLTQEKDLSLIVGGYAHLVDRILAKGFDLNATNNEGKTLLHIAAAKGKFDVVKYLIVRGAEVNVMDNDGKTPLHYSISRKSSDLNSSLLITLYLLCHGADKTIQDKSGLTPVEYFKLWQEKISQFAVTDEENSLIKQATDYLIISKKPEVKTSALPQFNQELQEYIEACKASEITLNKFENLPINEKNKALMDCYRDEVSGELITIPVKLYERVYNLETLLNILKHNNKDLITNREFNLSDIVPAKDLHDEINDFVAILQKNYSSFFMQPKPNPHTNTNTIFNLFSNTFNLFKDKAQRLSLDEVKYKRFCSIQ